VCIKGSHRENSRILLFKKLEELPKQFGKVIPFQAEHYDIIK